MELKQIKELMSFMKKEGIKKVSLKEKSGFELQIENQDETPSHPPAVAQYYPSFPPMMKEHHEERHSAPPILREPEVKGEKAEGKYVVSPLVGTFYTASSPDDPAFVKVGDRVEENTVVCIIEAMKVMNEVKSGISGVVAEIFVENAHPVEFGTKIFRIV